MSIKIFLHFGIDNGYIFSKGINPYLAFRDNSRAGGGGRGGCKCSHTGVNLLSYKHATFH